MPVKSPIIVALDYPDIQSAMVIANQLNPNHCRVKIGKELFTAAGPRIVEMLIDKGFDVFLDLKFHDIPNTASHAVTAAANLGVWMINVHASGGSKMMEACKEALDKMNLDKAPLLIAVTVLTSLHDKDLKEVSVYELAQDQVVKLALLAKNSGLDGVVCSAEEAETLRRVCGASFTLVTPGIRPSDYTVCDDQKRVVTPREAMEKGSDYLVVGRPITQSGRPAQMIETILFEL